MLKEHEEVVNERADSIRALYKELLNREADDSGFNNYFKSQLRIDEIKEALMSSVEYLEKRRVKEFGKVVEEIGTEELMLLGSCPRTAENVDILKKRGVKSILCLDSKSASLYDHNWVDNFLCVDMEVNKFFTKEKVELALKFLYDSIEVKKVPTYIHSDTGMERSPLLGALFLVATKGTRYNKALELIMSKSRHVNPNKFYVRGSVLEHVIGLRGKLEGYKHIDAEAMNKIIKITENVYFTSDIKEEAVENLRRIGFKSILDLNKEKTKLDQSSSGGWFNHIHLPVIDEQIKNLIPTILKNILRLEKSGKVLVSNIDKGILFTIYGEMSSGGAYTIDDHNGVLKGIFNL